jgi:predicted alpha-1,2-mannosidase
MRNPLTLLCLTLGLAAGSVPGAPADYTRFVDPFIGCAENGHTFPGACAPFGNIQVGPDTGNGDWSHCSGYLYADTGISGFSQNHLNGTGNPELGDILLQPFTGDAAQTNAFRSAYDKRTQRASPGYYGVTLADFGVAVELTATPRVAFHRYTYDGPGPARLLVDCQYGVVSSAEELRTHITASDVQLGGDRQTISGHTCATSWVPRQVFFALRLDRPYAAIRQLTAKPGEKAPRYVLDFDLKPGETLQAKVALSTVSVAGAEKNMADELPGWDFAAAREGARQAWNGLLGRAELEGTPVQRTAFYTALYRLCIQPNNIADTDGQYRGADDRVARAPDGAYYSTFSLWDTYRAAHPLYTILVPERVDGFIRSMLAHSRAQGHLPIWTLWGKENFGMVANHSVPVIADAYLKGFRGFDAEEAFRAVKTSLTADHFKSDWSLHAKHGYLPFDRVPGESVSRTLEYAYDDACAARLARALDKREDAAWFAARSLSYTNLFCRETRFMRGRDAAGNWRTPFDPFRVNHNATSGGDYTEGNAWQYTWHVQHDPAGLIRLLGGPEAFCGKLAALFAQHAKVEGIGALVDVSGLIGQYAHGNEPSHHTAYFFALAGQPWRTQELVRNITDTQYGVTPGGLCGNDDCGQMSAWYLFSVMGFYPFDPCGAGYVLGAPQVPKAVLHLPGGKRFTMEARNLSKGNLYVQRVTLDGRPFDGAVLPHASVAGGGGLVFEMGPQPRR